MRPVTGSPAAPGIRAARGPGLKANDAMHLDAPAVEAAIRAAAAEMPQLTFPAPLLAKLSSSAEGRPYQQYLTEAASGYLRFLPLLIRRLGLKHIVELGNREGLSTLCLFSALDAGSQLVTVDLVKDQRFCPDEMFRDSRVRFVHGDVADLGIYGDAVPMDIDLLFSDTIHFDRQVRDEFAIYQPLLTDRAVLAIDDINLNDKRKLFDELPYAKWDLTELCHGSGFGLVLFERKQPIAREARLALAFAASAQVWKRRCEEASRAPLRLALGSMLQGQPRLRRLAGTLLPARATRSIKRALRMS